jgi:hypothetical protein
MSATEIARLIAELRAGRLSVEQVAGQFRHRDWRATRRQPPASYREMAAQQDVEVDVPGSVDEVTAAYDRGELTSEEYRVLCDAIADSVDGRPDC